MPSDRLEREENTQSVAIIADSIACLTREQVAEYGINILPINFYTGGTIYRDWVDVTPSQAYELFLKDPDSFKTSAPNLEECLRTFRTAAKRAHNILCVTLSTKLSTLYNTALSAREDFKSEFPQIRIEIMDSLSATAAEGMVALAAARAAAENKIMEEVVSAAEKVKSKVSAIILLDTIQHVYRSGRIPKIASQIGSALSIRPILTISKAVNFSGVVRSRKHGIERILQMMRDKVKQYPVHVAVTHAYALDEAEKLKKLIADEFNCVELYLTEFSPVMGYACGTGTVGMAFYTD